MAKRTNYERLYKAVKSILKWHAGHEQNEYAREAYSSTLNQMKKLEALERDVRRANYKSVFVDGEPVQ